MHQPAPTSAGIPTNIITGFLGVGKTSAILHLLERKPAAERWAVLVNEFGEIGVDGSLLQGRHGEQNGIYVREVPGGCMCCAAGLPMQIALAQLLRRAQPDRLLIEPTGLGHPVEVLQVLTAEHMRDVLSIQKTLTLVDARKLADPRYTQNATFNQQIAIADIVVGNKQDLCLQNESARLSPYVRAHAAPGTDIVFTRFGELAPHWLQGATAAVASAHRHHLAAPEPVLASPAEDLIPECGYVSAVNRGEGFESIGWRFSPSRVFDRNRLFLFLSGLRAERMKAVFITGGGIFGYNLTSDTLTETELDDCMESRIEIIAPQLEGGWEGQLLACIADQS